MAPKIVGWVKGTQGLLWHAVRADGRAACGRVGYTGAPVPYTQIPAGQPPGICDRIGCGNARRAAEAELQLAASEPDWLITSITDHGAGRFYRFTVEGENRSARSALESRFFWNVHDIANPRYAVHPAATAETRAAVERAKAVLR